MENENELELKTQKEGDALTIFLIGEVNTMTAPQLKEILDPELPGLNAVSFDFEKCDFVSSAGLRILLATFKTLKKKKGKMNILNIGPTFKETLNITGLDKVFGCK